eukprot:751974-Hanusia_phi.AAC.1
MLSTKNLSDTIVHRCHHVEDLFAQSYHPHFSPSIITGQKLSSEDARAANRKLPRTSSSCCYNSQVPRAHLTESEISEQETSKGERDR